MNNLARYLLLAGALVLALLVGVLIGRGQHAEPTAGNSQVQITTAPPPMAPVAPPPPAPERPKPAAIPKVAPDLQVQEDAAAVGMTTTDGADQGSETPSRSAGGDSGNAQPAG
jgi:hypothetical protein